MKIIDLLKNETLSLSFEVFPPKTETSFESVKTATEEIAKLKGLEVCPRCDARLEAGVNFCPKCGASLDGDVQ